ncbi:hypothetical protein IC612_06510 [Planobacterium sp. GCR5]|uniref:Uncharacterized protein n=1 Tax=Planobacterium oryzisoli TaxID=2771435 RepID=A0A930YW18_9FLAO|nr:hypothetical protein [Planobacterium oryzisoli]
MFTENLPYKLSEQMRFEYNRRLSDINYFISGRYDYYAHLKKDIETIQLLLALSIFYKRVLSNFDSATKFTSRVVFKSEAVSVQLGTYDLSANEIFKLNKTVLTFKKLMEEYSIPLGLFEYLETKELLRKIKVYKDGLDRNKDNG